MTVDRAVVARQVRQLEQLEGRVRGELDTMTRMLAAERSPPLEELRSILEQLVTDLVRIRREHAEHFSDDERTPMPRRTPSQTFGAVTGIVGRMESIFEDAKRKP